MDLRQRHIEALRQTYPQDAVTVHSVDSMTVRKPHNGSQLSLQVRLPPNFPQEAPEVTAGQDVRLPIFINQQPWNAAQHVLVEAVNSCFDLLQVLWGSVVPLSLDLVEQLLQDKSQEVLTDLARNTNAVQPFAFQLPYARQLREECNRCSATLEQAAAKSSSLQQELHSAVVQIFEANTRIAALQEEINALQPAIQLSESLGTKQNVVSSLETVLNDNTTERSPTESWDSYVDRTAQYHRLCLLTAAYKQQPHQSFEVKK